jgi:predicted AAA+ superfamily ATPase
MSRELKSIFKEVLAENLTQLSDLKWQEGFVVRDLNLEWMPRKATVLKGIRRSGKSTLAEMSVSKKCLGDRILKINFADERIHQLKAIDLQWCLQAFFELYPETEDQEIVWMIFDEIQLVEGWEFFIERLLRQSKYRITVTGSSSKLLSQEIATELRGRSLQYEVFPLSFDEWLTAKKVNKLKIEASLSKKNQLLIQYLTVGGFPELLMASPSSQKKILQEYFESICFRDVVERRSLDNVSAVKEIALGLAGQHAQLVTVNKTFERLKSQGYKVQKEFVSIVFDSLQDSYSFFFIPIWSESKSKQMVNPKKVYCIDCGLVNAVRAGFLQNMGRLFEGAIFTELLRREYKIFYFKTQSGLEVDFIAQDQEDQIYAIQVCYELTSQNVEREVQSLIELHQDKRTKNAKCILIIQSKLDFKVQIPDFIDVQTAWDFFLQK